MRSCFRNRSGFIQSILFIFGGIFSPTGQAQLAQATPEVVVTATRFTETRQDLPVGVTVITSEDIRNSAAKTVPDLLSEQAGIAIHDFFGNNASNTTVDLRGFGASGGQNTLILLDGRRIGDIDLSGVQWSAIPFSAIDRIEIVRGSGGVLYGDGASAGVINIITRSPIGGGNSASASLRVGSYGTRDGQFNGNLRNDRVGINMTASNFESNGYRANNANRQSNALADLRWLTDGGEIALKLATDNQGLRLPGARRVEPSKGTYLLFTDPRGAATPLDYAQRTGNQANLDWRHQMGATEFIVGAGYREKKQKSYFDFSGFPDYREVDLNVWSFTPRVRFSQPLHGLENALVVGYDDYRWDYRLDKSNSVTNIVQPVNRVTAVQRNRAFYMQDKLRLDERTTLVAGARRERFSVDGNDVYDAGAPGGGFGSAAPPASQVLTVSAWELAARYQFEPRLAGLARYSRSYRLANVDEAYETSPSPASAAQFQFLRPQINQSMEIGMEIKSGARSLRATVFNINVNDEVHLDPYSDGIGNTNLPPSRRRGFELDGNWKMSESLALRAAYTYTDARFREGSLAGGAFGANFANIVIAGKKVPLVPQQKANLTASWAIAAKTRLVGSAAYVASQFMDNDEGNTLGATIPAYTVVDFRAVHEQGAWRLSAGINNLFDRKYFNYAVRSVATANPDRYNAYPLPTRNAALTLEYSYR